MAMIRPETEMKDSGVQWLGNVPKEWSVGKVKHEFYAAKTIVGDKVNDYERLALTLNGVIKRSKDAGDGLQPEKFDGYQILKEHELVFKLIDLANVSTSRVGLSPYTGIVSHAYIVLHHRKDMNPRYGEYYFLSMWMNEVFNHIGGDGVRSALNAKDLLNIPYLKVSSDEQQAIADYLDETCSKIDEIIAEAKASIDEYKELKIGQINKYTIHKMKRTKLKYITEKIGDGIHATPEYSDEGIIRFINGGSFGEDSIKMIGPMLSNEEYQKQNKSLLNEHTVMIALNGANFGNTSLYNNEAILLGKSAGYITLKSTVCREYVRYCLENSVIKEAFDLSLNGTTIPNLSLNTLRNTEICLPDYSVQKQLAKTIKKMIIKIDSLIAEKESLINDLEVNCTPCQGHFELV